MDAKDFVFNKSKTNCTRPSVHYNKQVCPRLEVHHFYFIALVFVKYAASYSIHDKPTASTLY